VPALAVVQMLIRVALQIPYDLVSSDSLGPSPPSCHLVLSLPLPSGHDGPWPPSAFTARHALQCELVSVVALCAPVSPIPKSTDTAVCSVGLTCMAALSKFAQSPRLAS